MRTSAIAFTILTGITQLLVAAPGRGQDRIKKNISLDYHNAAFTTVVKAIEQKSGLIIMYELTPAIENERLTLAIKDRSVADALDLLVTGRKLRWSLDQSENIVRLERVDDRPAPPPNAEQAPPNISGVIKDALGHPLAGATIAIRNGKTSTTSNAEGFFTIPAKEGDVLICTYVSCEPRFIRVSSEMQIKASLGEIVLTPAASGLDEMVIIAYGTTTRRLATGSVSTVSGEEIRRQPVSNVLETLEGKAPGLFISQSNGAPGSQMNISIRGQLSIASGQLPLFIIDGVPFVETPINQLGSSTYGQQGAAGPIDPMNSINPSDIESISVLKDADATAIYGSRGANGVILITTRRGKAGATRFDLNASTGAGRITRTMPMLDLHQYLAMRHAAFANDNATPTLSNAPDLLSWDTTKSTGFNKQFIGGTARQTEVTGSFSGGDQRLHYLFSNTFRHQGTSYPGDFGYNRYSSHLSIDNTSADGRFGITATAIYSKESNNQSLTDITSQVYNLPPDYPVYNANGTLNWTGGITNPMSYLLQTSAFRSDNLLANASLRYTILPGLNAKLSAGYNKINQSITTLMPLKSANPNTTTQSSAGYSSNYVESYIVEPQLDYIKALGKGRLTATLGGTWQQSNFVQPYFVNATGFSNDDLMSSWTAASAISYKNSGYTSYKYASGFARLNYTWLDRYLLTLTGRRDGSSRFGPDHRWGNFGSVGGGWIFTGEPWMKKPAPWLSYGKLRASYGTIGNDQIQDYGYLSTYSVFWYSYGGASIYPSRIANPDYGWETSRKIDAALETGFIKDRILFTVNWFTSRTGNQLINSPLAAQTGFTTYQANLPALLQSSGWEFELKTTNIKKHNLTWTSSFNLTIPRNKLLSFPGLSKTGYAYVYVVGKPINNYNGFHFTGLTNGIATVADLNKDGTISQGLPALKGDYYMIATSSPKFYGGFSNTIQYGQLQLDILLQFVKQLKPGFRQSNTSAPGFMVNQDSHILSDGFKPTMTAGSTAAYAYTNYYLMSDASYSDASFIRLKNLSLTYDLPGKWTKAAKIRNAGVFVRGQNLLTITSYFGFDPETAGYSLPPLRQVVAGIHCSL
ncbi:MAG: SusC/RagA family TonB-linked outer membrane protein [Bacteroidetes bacterium]|nr:SusC/RagA family TonB-linked outer membrane protein [Bacteroidota bacterium]